MYRSQIAFAFGALIGVRNTLMPDVSATRIEGRAEFAVVVPDDESRTPAIGCGLPQLLRDPELARLPCHPEVNYTPRFKLDDEEDEELLANQHDRLC